MSAAASRNPCFGRLGDALPEPSHGKDFLSGRLTHADEQEPRTVEPGKNTLNTDPLPAWLSTAMEPR